MNSASLQVFLLLLLCMGAQYYLMYRLLREIVVI